KTIFPEIEKLYKDEDIFTQNLRITTPSIFKEIYDTLNPLELTYINEDIKGAAFEYFLANSPSADKDLGEYFTPRHIVRTMVKLIDPQIGEKIYDPFCGTGGMLIESYKHIEQSMEHTPANIKKLQEETLFGRDLTENARIAKMNMILAGDGHSNISKGDSLTPTNLATIEDKFDIVITNFPFAQDTDYGKYYDIPTKNGNSICLQHCMKALKDGGRMAIVVPETVMFKPELTSTRKYLLEHFKIENIVHLPAGVFEPYTNVETHIIHAIKKKSPSKIWFFTIKNDGYTLDKTRTEIKDERSDLDKFLSFKNVNDADKENFGFIAIEKSKIISNDYTLLSKNYRDILTEQDSFTPLRQVLLRSKK
ncbi:MAG TPA: N-6 DNA methylase, partial [Aquella sp.]|nr:N-6 DNA methylase [Aquella sp.]